MPCGVESNNEANPNMLLTLDVRYVPLGIAGYQGQRPRLPYPLGITREDSGLGDWRVAGILVRGPSASGTIITLDNSA